MDREVCTQAYFSREPKQNVRDDGSLGLRKIFKNTHSSPFVAVMVDQTTDKSNKEQLTLVLRWISEDFVVFEEFVGLYFLSAIDAQSIVEVMKDAFIRFQIPLTKIHGQCYDGSSTMAGAKAVYPPRCRS